MMDAITWFDVANLTDRTSGKAPRNSQSLQSPEGDTLEPGKDDQRTPATNHEPSRRLTAGARMVALGYPINPNASCGS